MSKAVVVVLTAEEFGSLASAAAATARNNLKAADHLLAGGFWPQARALAVLAYEEAGKSWLCTTAMLSPDDMREQLPVGELNWHVSKLTSARTLTAFLSLLRTENATLPLAADLLAELTELAGEDETSKERCLYTDYRDGEILSPSHVTEAEARATVALVRDVLDRAGPIVDLAVSFWLAREVPPSVQDLYARAAEALSDGTKAMEAFVQDEMSKMGSLAGILQGPAAESLREAWPTQPSASDTRLPS